MAIQLFRYYIEVTLFELNGLKIDAYLLLLLWCLLVLFNM